MSTNTSISWCTILAVGAATLTNRRCIPYVKTSTATPREQQQQQQQQQQQHLSLEQDNVVRAGKCH